MKAIVARLGFCTVKNYTSTFRIRSRLSDFFKHVHPDQLHQAPTRVKEENLRSLTNFNAYIDAINQKKPIEGKQLKFYLSQKTNLKSKKFYSFGVELPTIETHKAEMSEEQTKKLVDNIVEVLNRKFLESKLGTKREQRGKEKTDQIDLGELKEKESKEDKFDRMASKLAPFTTQSARATDEERRLQSELNSKYLEAEKEALATRLRKTISFADTRSNKPMMWSRIAAEQSGVFRDFQKIFDELIDPRLIYFHESLTLQEIQTFKKNIMPGSLTKKSYDDFQAIASVCGRMESMEPPLCFFVHNRYSGSDIPGFFTIPFNFKAKELEANFNQLLDVIIEETQKYEQFYDYYCELRERLRSENHLDVQEVHFDGNSSIWMCILALKRLQKFQVPQPRLTILILTPQEMGLYKSKHSLEGHSTVIWRSGKLVASMDFAEEEMKAEMEALIDCN